MLPEPLLSEMLQWFFVNIISSLVGSQLHKTLYYTLGLTYWAMHFLHYLFTFLLLIFISLTGGQIQNQWIPMKIVFPLASTEALASFSSCIIHHGGSDGAIHSIRVVDFMVTILVIVLGRIFLESSARPDSKAKLLLVSETRNNSVFNENCLN